MGKHKLDDGQQNLGKAPETEEHKPDSPAEESKTDDEATDSEQEAKADADKNADFENTQHVPNDISDLLAFAKSTKASAQ